MNIPCEALLHELDDCATCIDSMLLRTAFSKRLNQEADY
jgi:hypothetical protein